MIKINYIYLLLIFILSVGCAKKSDKPELEGLSPKEILSNPDYLAICYGGYRATTREVQPTISDIKEDLLLLEAIGVKILRTHDVHTSLAENTLKAIRELKKEKSDFEMYMMLGVWIDCKDAWTSYPNHNEESERNSVEIDKAVSLVNSYPDIVKVMSIGNEAMVKWATSYYVFPKTILKWVNHVQQLKKHGQLPHNLWVTSSDNFASWGGGDASYQTEDLKELAKAVDYISIHTYPMHDTHYNPVFWKFSSDYEGLTKESKIDTLMMKSIEYAKSQYLGVKKYVEKLGLKKQIHIGETGWATQSSGFYGVNGSRATDEYKQKLYYDLIRDWTKKENISCFFFEAFDEQWKDSGSIDGEENNFGLFTLDGKAKYCLWDFVDDNAFKGLGRNGIAVRKSFNGNKESLMDKVLVP